MSSSLSRRWAVRRKKKKAQTFQFVPLVGVERLELSASASRTQRATNCAIPRKKKEQQPKLLLSMVGEEGFEPSQTESESVVLPLHNSPISSFAQALCPRCVLYYIEPESICQHFF